MRIKGVNFPEILLTAQKNGRLVIFAGAGVSIPPPSNFPNFNGLVEKVAAGTLERLGAEPPVAHRVAKVPLELSMERLLALTVERDEELEGRTGLRTWHGTGPYQRTG